MLRKLLPVAAVCAALFASGCEKKEPKAAPPVRVARPAVRAPAGMVPVMEGAAVFIATRPLAVGQYVAYLEGTGQDVPPQWQELQPGSPDAGLPAVGLTRAEARRCAVWHLKRLPTAEEWRTASEVVSPRPYPWHDDGSPVAPSAEVFLVQGYPSHSPEEMKARRDRDELAQTILEEYLAETEALAARTRDQLAAERARRERAWQELKPAFFALLDREKELARERATRQGHREALDVVNRLAADKGQLAIKLKVGDLSAEQADAAAEQYGRQLAEARAKAQQARERLQNALDAAQQQVVELSAAFERLGVARAGEGLAEIEQMLADAAGRPETISLAAALKLRLEAAAGRVKAAAAAVSALPDLEGIQQQAARVEEQMAQLPVDDAVARIDELGDKMARLGEDVAREFLQEKELIKDLEELVDLRARKEAAEARLRRLKEALENAA